MNFSPQSQSVRRQSVMSALPENIDAALVTSDISRLYLTGLNSSAGTLLLTRDKAYLIIDSRYIEIARKTAAGCEVILQEDVYAQLNGLFASQNIKHLAIENETMTIATLAKLKTKLTAQIDESAPLSGLIAALRQIKSRSEIACVQAAQDITDKAFTHILNYIKEGVTEIDIAAELEYFMRKAGAERISFDTIVAAGKNSSMPHAAPTSAKVKPVDLVTMDFGCVVSGYCSDMTRTVAVGKIGPDEKKVYDTVLRAQLEAIAAISISKTCDEIDKVARDIIDAAGYQGCFGHGLGHSVGLEIHEAPSFSPSCKDPVRIGHLMTVEPGIYLETRFGCRIEDMVYVTADGVVNLTKSPKELIIL